MVERATKNLPLSPSLPVLYGSLAGNCAPLQDVVKPNGSLFPASIILVLDLSDSITRASAPVLRTYIRFASYISCVITIPVAVSASTAESQGELRPARSWKIEKSISILVHELCANSRASAYEPDEISHYPARLFAEGIEIFGENKTSGIIAV